MISFLTKMMNGGVTRERSERVYLDHAGSTPMSECAKRELSRALEVYGNPSAIYKEGVIAKNLLASSREKIARLLSCHSYELYFTGSGTESITLAITGTVDYWYATHKVENSLLRPHIITSVIEHPAVLETLRTLERARKIDVTYLPVTREGFVQVKDVREAVSSATILVSIMYANNEIGTVQPIKEIGRLLAQYREEHKETRNSVVEKAYPYFHSDACQAPNYLPIDTKSLRVDMMTLNSSKVYGPKGVGLLFKREGVMVLPQVYGGGQERGMRSGTEVVPQIASFAEALVEVSEMRVVESARLREINQACVKALTKAIHSIIFYGKDDTNNHTLQTATHLPNTINCRIPSIISEEVILRLDAKGFAVSHKSACAAESESGSHVILALGATEQEASENIRITMGRSTTHEDMTRLVEVMQEIAMKYSK